MGGKLLAGLPPVAQITGPKSAYNDIWYFWKYFFTLSFEFKAMSLLKAFGIFVNPASGIKDNPLVWHFRILS